MRYIRLLLILVVLFTLDPPAAGACCVESAVSPDGQTTVHTDGEQVFIEGASGLTVEQAGIIHLVFMDNDSVLMNRVDRHLFILDVHTGAVFHVGYQLRPDDSCSPCDIGGEG